MRRRMIAPDIISEGKFLRMSLTAQALYMHLVANADDDGCVDAYMVTRLIGAKEDDLVLLKEREYITVLDEHEWILWITGWQDFNRIDARIKQDSKYLPLLRAKVQGVDIVKSTAREANKARYQRLKVERSVKKITKTNDPHEDHTMISGETPEKNVTSIDKYSIDISNTNRITNNISKDKSLEINEISKNYKKWLEEFQKAMGFLISKEPKKNEAAVKNICQKFGKDALHQVLAYLHFLKSQKKTKERPYWFQYITSFIKISAFWDNIQASMTNEIWESALTEEDKIFFGAV